MQQRRADVIIVGGGIAGLAAAGELGREGYSVLLLEARRRLGGRVLTERRRGWSGPVELGAQFVHGGNDAFWRLLKRHRIRTEHVPAHHWWPAQPGFLEIDATKRIAAVTGLIDEETMRNVSFAKFMAGVGSDLDPIDRQLAIGFVEGFEAAPTNAMSAVAVAGETLEDDEQYVLPAGYDEIVTALVAELERTATTLFLDAPCRHVAWSRGTVRVRTPGAEFSARALITTVPIAVLQTSAAKGGLRFSPAVPALANASRAIGVGHVIRLTFRFDGRRWERLWPEPLRRLASRGFGFIHSSGDGVSVWWSLSSAPVLTGWAGGPNALALSGRSDRQIIHAAVFSLARLMRRSRTEIAGVIADVATHNWTRDPYSRGAYSFARVGAEEAVRQLRTPVRDTLFFAGEATADGAEVGTAHGAFSSGRRAAREVAGALR
jgi:monoamine oxidase